MTSLPTSSTIPAIRETGERPPQADQRCGKGAWLKGNARTSGKSAVYDAGPMLPYWTRPNPQMVPVNRLALASLVTALLSTVAVPLCVGLAGSAAAIVMAYRARGQLQPADVRGARLVWFALLVSYVTWATVLVFAGALVVVVLIASRDQVGGLVALIGVLMVIMVELLALAAAFIMFIVFIAELLARHNDRDRLGPVR